MNEVVSGLNGFDFVLLILVAGSLAASLARGFTREIVGLVALISGIVLGLWFHGSVGALVAAYVSRPELAGLVGFAVIFFGVLIVGGLIGQLLAKVWKVTGLSFVDRLAGGVFGLVKGVLIGSVIIFVTVAFSPAGPPQFVQESKIAPYVMWSSNMLASMAPRELRDVVEQNIATLRGLWQQAPGMLPSFPGTGNAPESQDGESGPQASPSPPPERWRQQARKPSPYIACIGWSGEHSQEQNL